MADQKPERHRKKVVGEPYEGKPHVQFEVARDGNRYRHHPLTLLADPEGRRKCKAGSRYRTDRISLGLNPLRHSSNT